MKLCRKQ